MTFISVILCVGGGRAIEGTKIVERKFQTEENQLLSYVYVFSSKLVWGLLFYNGKNWESQVLFRHHFFV